MISFGKKGVVALDIGSYSIKLVELKETKKGYRLVNIGEAPLPPEAIVDGALMDSGAITLTITNLIANTKTKTRDVVTSISGHSVIIKKISLPTMTEDELADSIQWEAEQYIPFDIADVNLDFAILGASPSDPNQMDVLLVAAKKETIDDYTAVLFESGLNPVVIDVDVFAIQNMLELNYPLDEEEVVAIANIGAELTNVNVIRGGISLFTRDIASGGGLYNEEIQKRFGVGYEDADAAKLGGEVEGVDGDELETILRDVSESLVAEIARTIDFFMTTNPEDKVARTFICGGGARVAGIDKTLAERLGMPVEVANPFNVIAFKEKRFDPDYIAEVAPSFGVAVGLAIRKGGD